MGHFSHNCKLTGLPITGGEPAVLIVMKMIDNLYDLSEEHLRKYGSCYMCSNESTRLKFSPVWFPIIGEYDDYGGIAEIVHDDNTKILEDYYGLTIDEIMSIVCSGRKDDGYDGSLKIVKKPQVIPDDYLENEDHFHYYQRTQNDPQPFDGRYPDCPNNTYRVYRDGTMVETTKEEYDANFKIIHDQYGRYQAWKKINPDPVDDYGHPEYQERYKELITYSGMWIHGLVYEELTKEKKTANSWGSSLGIGTPELLTALGFERGEKNKNERYNIPFTKDGFTLYSDGTWLHDETNVGLYYFKTLKKFCEENGVNIDITEIDGKDTVEQTYDYCLPTYKVPLTEEEYDEMLEGLTNNEARLDMLLKMSLGRMDDRDNMPHYFLNSSRYSVNANPLTPTYIRAAKEGKLRDNLVRFWRFNSYMYDCGKYYEIVGTGPQDGHHEGVAKVLSIATSVLNDVIEERKKYGDYDEDELPETAVVVEDENTILKNMLKTLIEVFENDNLESHQFKRLDEARNLILH